MILWKKFEALTDLLMELQFLVFLVIVAAAFSLDNSFKKSFAFHTKSEYS